MPRFKDKTPWHTKVFNDFKEEYAFENLLENCETNHVSVIVTAVTIADTA